jgi:hypothetical protein
MKKVIPIDRRSDTTDNRNQLTKTPSFLPGQKDFFEWISKYISDNFTTMISPILHYSFRAKINRLRLQLETEFADDFLELLLGAMSILLRINKKFRKNIDDFSAIYVFKDKSGKLAASAIFSNGRMKVSCKEVPGAIVTVIFDRGKSLCNLLLAKDPNIFDFLLENKLTYSGNLNYLLKFAYLARHIAPF